MMHSGSLGFSRRVAGDKCQTISERKAASAESASWTELSELRDHSVRGRIEASAAKDRG